MDNITAGDRRTAVEVVRLLDDEMCGCWNKKRASVGWDVRLLGEAAA